MRGVLLPLLAGCVAGCLALTGCLPAGRGGPCTSDDACDSDEVCARNRFCSLTSEVRSVQVNWTVNGLPADDLTCSASPDLMISFVARGDLDDELSFSPVPCRAGRFSVDKLPRAYTSVRLGGRRDWESASFDADGMAAIDL